MPFLRAALLLLLAGAACQQSMIRTDEPPSTVPEVTAYQRTSSHAEVLAFLDAVDAAGDPRVVRLSFGTTPEGRDLPLVVVADPPVSGPAQALRSAKPRVLVMANIHAGEVEGKEACLELLRDIVWSVRGEEPWPVASVIALFVPIYNADGNDRFGPENRPHQNGPDEMGVRTTSLGLDLNRDYMKLENLEARELVQMLDAWDPHVVVDLHTTNGSAHGYELTYAPPLTPAAHPALLRTLAGKWLPVLRERMRARHGFETFDYGNIMTREGALQDPPGGLRGWRTFSHLPRFGNNYIGLRNRIAILSEAYSCSDFATRIASTRVFVLEILRLAAEEAGRLDGLCREWDADTARLGGKGLLDQPLEAGIASRGTEAVLLRPVELRRNPRTGVEMRVAAGVRSTVDLPCLVVFETRHSEAAPRAYLLPPDLEDAARHLRLHGVEVQTLEEPDTVTVLVYTVAATALAEEAYQGHRLRRVQWQTHNEKRTLPAGSFRVPMGQPLARLTFQLLDPEAEDGMVAWNFFDSWLEKGAGAELPVYPLR